MKVIQQLLKALLHHSKIVVVSESRQKPSLLHTRLPWIKFPWMEVENERFGLLLIDGLQCIACKPIRKQPEIAAAGNRGFSAEQESG